MPVEYVKEAPEAWRDVQGHPAFLISSYYPRPGHGANGQAEDNQRSPGVRTMNATKPRTWVKDDNYYRCDSLAIVKVGGQWRIFNHVKTNDVGNYVGKLPR